MADGTVASFQSLSQVIQREGGVGDGTEGECEERAFEVVARDAVGLEHATAGAAVDEGPFAVLADLDGDRFHSFAAGAAAVAGLVVEVARPEAAGAVVAVARAEGLGWDLPAAGEATERGVFA
jgi:hypothetical protein